MTTCRRNGCDRPATCQVIHDHYPTTRTPACWDHGRWWITGFAGDVLGKVEGFYG